MYQNHYSVYQNEKIIINVSGMHFETWSWTLGRFPNTLLGNPGKRKKYFDYIHNEYFFEREEVINKYKKDEGYMVDKEANFNDLPKNRIQRSIWLLFEYPHSSIFARIIAVISVVVVVVSITLFCAETIPEIRARRNPANQSQPVTSSDSHKSPPSSSVSSTPSLTAAMLQVSSLTPMSPISAPLNTQAFVAIKTGPVRDEFFVIETICIIWFSIELVMRFYSSPSRLAFVKQFGNIIDFFSILPYFMEATETSARFSILRIIRLVRVFRIFKLARHFKGLQILAHTLKASLNELILLVFFLIIGVILFSSIVYFLELDDSKSDFHSIPDGFWYAIITMTTVGYGEIVPKTVLGKVIGCFCAIAGVLTIALPVPIIVSHFQYFSRSNEALKKVNKETLRKSYNLKDSSSMGSRSFAMSQAGSLAFGMTANEFIDLKNKYKSENR